MAGNCDATNGAGRSNAPMPGSVSSAACWFATNICLPFTVPFSISPVSGSPYENVFETRSSRNGQFGAAIALILRLQAIATAVLKALAGLPLNPAN